MSRSFGPLTILLCASLLGVACEEKKTSSESRADAQAATDKYATADPKLEKALKATAAASGSIDNGPPPSGIFPPGGAEQRHPKGTPTKVDLVTDGAEPRVALGPGPEAPSDAARTASYGPALLELAVQAGQRGAVLVVDLALVLGPAKKDEGASDWLVATVKKAAPAKDQSGQLAPGAEKQIGSLEGTQLRIEMKADGRAGSSQTQLGKTSVPELDQIARSATEALVMATVPIPPQPVGTGAMWIAETRMAWGPSDVIAYRAYRVKSVDGDRIHLSITVKAYATQKDPQLEGLPKGATLVQFEAEAQGEAELVRGEILPRKSNMQQRMAMFLSQGGASAEPEQPGEPGRGMLTAQVQGQATFVRGGDLRAMARP